MLSFPFLFILSWVMVKSAHTAKMLNLFLNIFHHFAGKAQTYQFQ